MPVDEGPVAAPRVSFRVETDGLGDGADESMRTKILEVGAALVVDRGFVDATQPNDPRIVIAIERAGDVENPGFAIGYLIESGDEVVPGSARQSECSLCTRTEVVELIERDLPELLALARGHQVEPAEAEAGDTDGTTEGPADTDAVDTRKIGPLGFAGIGVAVVGIRGRRRRGRADEQGPGAGPARFYAGPRLPGPWRGGPRSRRRRPDCGGRDDRGRRQQAQTWARRENQPDPPPWARRRVLIGSARRSPAQAARAREPIRGHPWGAPARFGCAFA